MHEGLQGLGLTNTYGLSIVAFTVLVKVVTLPLNYKQIESTTKMQAIQPMMKEIQAKYKSDPQLQQQKMAALYSVSPPTHQPAHLHTHPFITRLSSYVYSSTHPPTHPPPPIG